MILPARSLRVWRFGFWCCLTFELRRDQRQATRARRQVRCTFSADGPWRPAVVARLTQTLGITKGRHSTTAAISPAVSWHMNTAAKLLVSMRRSQLDWQIGDLQTVARQNNIDWRHQKSSHCVFIREDGRTLSVPAHRPIKVIYVRKFVELIDGA